MSPFPSVITSWALGLVALLLPVWLGLAIARAARRHDRSTARARALSLARLFRGHLRGRVPAFRLLLAVRAASASVFWSALEARLPHITRPERRSLGRLLERSHPLTDERRALVYDSPLRRELAARRLGLLPCARSRRALRSAMGVAPEAVAYAAARALARDANLTALDWLLASPAPFPRRTQQQWAQLLRAFGRRALPRLTESIENGIDDAQVLRAAIEALGSRRHATAAPAIERMLAHPTTDVRVAAARALGRIESWPCSDALVRALKDSAWPVRAQAAWALGRLKRDPAVPALQACLIDREWWVRRHAAYALAELGERGADALRMASSTSADRYARDIADEALQSLNRSA